MTVLVKTLGFSLGLTLFFTLVANLLPQLEGERPADPDKVVSEMDLDEFVAWGETLYHGKGNCALCHLPPPNGRAPALLEENLLKVAGERIAAADYAGGAGDALGYLRESLVEPDAYVVPGWGKVGADDRKSPMPAVQLPPIELSEEEVDAVLAFLQAKDGHPVTVEVPQAAALAAAPVVPKTDAQAVLKKYACAACHALDSDAPGVGPGLASVGERLDTEELRQSILQPNAVITPGFMPAMPAEIGKQMSEQELEVLVQWLSERRQ